MGEKYEDYILFFWKGCLLLFSISSRVGEGLFNYPRPVGPKPIFRFPFALSFCKTKNL